MISLGQQKRKDSDSHLRNDRWSWDLICRLRNRKVVFSNRNTSKNPKQTLSSPKVDRLTLSVFQGKSGSHRFPLAIAALSTFLVIGVVAYFFVPPHSIITFHYSPGPRKVMLK
jgi:hypothetical protein